jgi:colanic acid biosynthesis glycosyl transferase WcaI
MRLLVHDYSGHPFQVQLSRELARRGHSVRHVYSSSFQTPKGNLAVGSEDPPGLEILPVALGSPFQKDSFVRRRAQEIETGKLVAAMIEEFRPQLVISSNAPLDTQRVIKRTAQRMRVPFVFWLQDIYSEAIKRLLPSKLPVLGSVIAPYYQRLEFKMLRESDHIVAISRDFVDILLNRGVPLDRISVIENWAPLDEFVPVARNNEWAERNMPGQGLRIVYSGTLGYKHNPSLLVDIAESIPCQFWVYAEGAGAEQLRREAASRNITNLFVRDWVKFEDLPKLLSGADILVAMIEADAGVFSVPSKVLSYFAVGRPVVASIPADNLARRLIEREAAGLVAEPGDTTQLCKCIAELAGDSGRRRAMGDNARQYAERAFNLASIADRFERIAERCVDGEETANRKKSRGRRTYGSAKPGSEISGDHKSNNVPGATDVLS